MTRDASDADDERLIAEGRFADVVARHYDDLTVRARARLGPERAPDAVHAAVVRALGELSRGKTYEVPFRVAIHKMLGWAIADLWASPAEGALPEGWDVEDPAGADGVAAVVDRLFVEGMLDALPEGDGRVMRQRYLAGREIADIAADLGMSRNAVDQALWRGRRALGEAWLGG